MFRLAYLKFALALLLAGSAYSASLKPGLYAVFDTAEGVFTTVLYEKYAPNSVRTFVSLAAKPRSFYNGAVFHRVVREELIQAGGDCGIRIADEILVGLRFDQPGRLAMANAGPNTGGCQFFITSGSVPRWNGSYAIFGQVIEGQDVVDRINKGHLRGDQPVNPVRINSVTIRRVLKTN